MQIKSMVKYYMLYSYHKDIIDRIIANDSIENLIVKMVGEVTKRVLNFTLVSVTAIQITQKTDIPQILNNI